MSRSPHVESRPPGASGFTLVEVLVALVIVAFGMGAVLAALSNAAANTATLREKNNAQWIALNLIADQRLSLQQPSMGTVEGDVKNFANGNWHWQQQVLPVQGVPGIALITVSVRRTGNATNPPNNNSNSSASGTSTSGNGAGNGGVGNGTGSSTSTIGAGSASGIGNSSSSTSTNSSSGIGASGGLGSAGGLGATWGIGASTTVTLTTTTTVGAGSINAPVTLISQTPLGTPSGTGSPLSSSAMSAKGSTSSSSSDQPWLVTMIGFRGSALAATSGEVPDWTGTSLSSTGGTAGNGTTANGTSTNGTATNGTSSTTSPTVTAPNSPGSNPGIGANSAPSAPTGTGP
jgi:type II secretion system protein I